MLQNLRRTLGGAAMISMMLSPAIAQQSVSDLQSKFDHESNSVKKAKLLVKLGDAQFDEARRAGKEGDNNTVGFEVEDSMLAAPAPYKPPLQIVRQDLISMDEELIRLLFPHRPADSKPAPPPEEKKP